MFMIQNLENTESWQDKAGNTKVKANSKLASPPLAHFRAPFLYIHHQ